MRHILIALLLLSLPRAAFGLPVGELRRLAAYEAYLVATAVPPVPDTPCGPRPGICPECNGSGKVGDGTVFVTCGTCNGKGRIGKECQAAPVMKAAPPAPKPAPAVVRSAPPVIVREPGPQWNVEGNWNYSTQELADHLRRVHRVDVNGKTREELEALHDNLHNAEVSSAPVIRAPAPIMRSCPNGQCPTSPSQSYQLSPRRGLLRR